MSTEPAPAATKPGRFRYFAVVALTAVAVVAVTALLVNIFQRKQEAQQHFVKMVELDEDTLDPTVWAKNFPRHYDTYKLTVDTARTRHGGSEAIDKLKDQPLLKRLYAGYAFSIDFREERGHAYMLQDQDETKRVSLAQQYGGCLHCHASVMKAYRGLGKPLMKNDKDDPEWLGFVKMCGMTWQEGRKHVGHPVSCVDCHEPTTAQLRVTRPAFKKGMEALAQSDEPLPQLPSIDRWRKGGRSMPYDVNALASRQEMRSLACAQCHVEYYFKGEGKVLTYPWFKGLKAEQIEQYYDAEGFTDWVHKQSGAKVLKAQHPEFEMWSQGSHARAGVACADCHMPYMREGAVKISDHQVRSPLLNISRACLTCHRASEVEMKARAELIQDRTKALLDRSMKAVVELIDGITVAAKEGGDKDRVEAARGFQRKAQWRVDFVASENSLGFHAPQECARVLGEAIDYARQGQVKLLEKKK